MRVLALHYLLYCIYQFKHFITPTTPCRSITTTFISTPTNQADYNIPYQTSRMQSSIHPSFTLKCTTRISPKHSPQLVRIPHPTKLDPNHPSILSRAHICFCFVLFTSQKSCIHIHTYSYILKIRRMPVIYSKKTPWQESMQ